MLGWWVDGWVDGGWAGCLSYRVYRTDSRPLFLGHLGAPAGSVGEVCWAFVGASFGALGGGLGLCGGFFLCFGLFWAPVGSPSVPFRGLVVRGFRCFVAVSVELGLFSVRCLAFWGPSAIYHISWIFVTCVGPTSGDRSGLPHRGGGSQSKSHARAGAKFEHNPGEQTSCQTRG